MLNGCISRTIVYEKKYGTIPQSENWVVCQKSSLFDISSSRPGLPEILFLAATRSSKSKVFLEALLGKKIEKLQKRDPRYDIHSIQSADQKLDGGF